MKLSEAFNVYLAESGMLGTEQSIESYRKTVRQLIAFAGDRALASYTLDELTAFCLGSDGRGQAKQTVSARRNRIHSLFAWCAFRKMVPRDVTAHLKFTVKPRGGPVRKNRWINKRESAAIAATFNLEDPRGHRDYAVYRTTLMLGLRRSETASLRWSMFTDDLTSVTFVGKGRKLATLALPPMLTDVLTAWHGMQPAGAVPFPRFQRQFDFAGNERLEPLWTSPLGPTGIYAIVRKYADVAPHDLRRSFAGILEADGVNLKDLQGLMRHSNVATTDVYLQNSPTRMRRAAEQVDWG